ncbi:MAG: hypothetical protein WKF78_09960 [Candidatus Limnocylindrales bacterium]
MTREPPARRINAVYAVGAGQRRFARRRPAKGLDFFKDLNDARATSSRPSAKPGTIDTGATPITIRWAYNALAHKDTAAGNPEIEVVVPKSGRFLGVYVAGHQRLRPASERRQAVDGVPVLRRGPGRLAEGLLPHHPTRRPGWPARSRAT